MYLDRVGGLVTVEDEFGVAPYYQRTQAESEIAIVCVVDLFQSVVVLTRMFAGLCF